jgi:hypothetical protein
VQTYITVSIPIPVAERLKEEAKRQGFGGKPKPTSRLVAELLEQALGSSPAIKSTKTKKGA